MDIIDSKILENLQANGKLTAKELASKLHLSLTPIYERISKLEKAGYIQKYVALLDPELLDCSVIVFINITVKEHHKEARKDMVEALVALPQIVELYNTSGTYDFVAKGRFKDIKEYRNFLVESLSNVKNISDIDSHITLEELKYTTALPLPSI